MSKGKYLSRHHPGEDLGILAISAAEQRFLWFSWAHSPSVNTYMCLFSTCPQLIPKDNTRGKCQVSDKELVSALLVWIQSAIQT